MSYYRRWIWLEEVVDTALAAACCMAKASSIGQYRALTSTPSLHWWIWK